MNENLRSKQVQDCNAASTTVNEETLGKIRNEKENEGPSRIELSIPIPIPIPILIPIKISFERFPRMFSIVCFSSKSKNQKEKSEL
jgi:hypothetical protein